MNVSRETPGFGAVEIHYPVSGPFNSKHPVYRAILKAGGQIKYYGRRAPYRYAMVPTDNPELVDQALAIRHECAILRHLDNDLREHLVHGGHVQGWAVVYRKHQSSSLAELTAAVCAMIGHVAEREAAAERHRRNAR